MYVGKRVIEDILCALLDLFVSISFINVRFNGYQPEPPPLAYRIPRKQCIGNCELHYSFVFRELLVVHTFTILLQL